MIDYSWYNSLVAPALKPPAWLFTPVWIFLYITIIISFVIYLKEKTEKPKTWGYVLFFTQLMMNLAWTPAFFGVKNIGLALLIIVLLDILVFFNIIEFFKISKLSSYFLIPYFIWILFATYLNFAYFVLN